MRTEVVGDLVVLNADIPVTSVQGADTATVIVGQVLSDLVVIDGDFTSTTGEGGCARREFTGEHDAAALVVALVEPNAVVIDATLTAQAVLGQTATVFGAVVTTDVVV